MKPSSPAPACESLGLVVKEELIGDASSFVTDVKQPTNQPTNNLLYLCEEMLFVACLTSQQHASVSQGRICSDDCTCCHTEIEVVDQTFYFTQSQYTDTGPTSPSTDPITPDACQGSHWSAPF